MTSQSVPKNSLFANRLPASQVFETNTVESDYHALQLNDTLSVSPHEDTKNSISPSEARGLLSPMASYQVDERTIRIIDKSGEHTISIEGDTLSCSCSLDGNISTKETGEDCRHINHLKHRAQRKLLPISLRRKLSPPEANITPPRESDEETSKSQPSEAVLPCTKCDQTVTVTEEVADKTHVSICHSCALDDRKIRYFNNPHTEADRELVYHLETHNTTVANYYPKNGSISLYDLVENIDTTAPDDHPVTVAPLMDERPQGYLFFQWSTKTVPDSFLTVAKDTLETDQPPSTPSYTPTPDCQTTQNT